MEPNNKDSVIEDLKDAKEMELFAKSEAGKVLQKKIKKEIDDAIYEVISILDNPDLQKFISKITALKIRLEFLKDLSKAGDIRKLIEKSLEEKDIV